MPSKIKKTQIETPLVPQGRDLFRTPRYAVELLIPYIPKSITHIWEPACGEGHITRVLEEHGYKTWGTDIYPSPSCKAIINFLSEFDSPATLNWAIITNPPFSLKRKFYLHCRRSGIPFALLIPADYCGWVIEAIQEGCEKIIPTRRIDYITPTGLSGLTGNTSNYHSLWLTWGFGGEWGLTRSETFVELTNEMKRRIL